MKKFFVGAALMASLACGAQAPKYVFYYIGDGMGLAPVVAAQTYNRTVLKNDQPLLMMQFPYAGYALTYSASSDVTDSAAAGTALATGHKTRNGMVAVTPDTVPVNSIAYDLKQKGYGIGIVTSVAPDDATPSVFYSHAASRKMSPEIDRQMAECGFEFVGGAGLQGTKDKDGKDTGVLKAFKDNKVQIIYGPDKIADIKSKRVLLLNPEDRHPSNIGATIDSLPGVLNLPLMTETCLKHLEKTSPDHFFMMVEGGNIDHSLHANDGGAAIKEILNFNQALKLAYDFYLAHPDETLIVVTADHDTGGMSQITTSLLYRIDYQKVSKDGFNNFCKSILKSRMNFSWDDMKQYLGENFGLFTKIPVSAQEEASLRDMFDKTFEQRNTKDQETLYANYNSFAVEVFRLFNKTAGLNFTTPYHSGAPVPVYAIGVGAERFSNISNNIDIPAKIRSIMEGK